MPNPIRWVLVGLLGLAGCSADVRGQEQTGWNGREIQFVVKAPPQTSANAEIWVTGSLPELCSWKPDCLKLTQTAPGLYEGKLRLVVSNPPAEEKIEFKITRGSYDTEASSLTGEPYSNFEEPGNSKTIVRAVAHWKDLPPQLVTGDLEIIDGFKLPKLNSTRTLRIWLPPSYRRNSAQRYPVIYFHDGQNLFDPRTSNSRADWMVDEAMTRLASRGLEAIVVGIDSLKGEDRMFEYDYTIRGYLYARDLIDTVKPFIDQKYRTLPGRETTFTAGSSMGSHMSLCLLLRHGDVFSAGVGPSLPAFIHDGSIYKVIQETSRIKQPGVRFYFDHGNWGMDLGYEPYAKKAYEALLNKGFDASNLRYEIVPYGDHTESDWARIIESRLEWLLRKQ